MRAAKRDTKRDTKRDRRKAAGGAGIDARRTPRERGPERASGSKRPLFALPLGGAGLARAAIPASAGGRGRSESARARATVEGRDAREDAARSEGAAIPGECGRVASGSPLPDVEPAERRAVACRSSGRGAR